MIRKSVQRFSLATNAERVCAEIMLKQRARARSHRALEESHLWKCPSLNDPLEIEGTRIGQPNSRAPATGLNDPSAGRFSRAMSGNIPNAGNDRSGIFPGFFGKNFI